MNYDAEIARLVDLYSTKCSTLTGKPEHRKKATLNLLRDMAEAIKKVVRENTLEFYQGTRQGAAREFGPLFTQPPLYIPVAPPGTLPPIKG